MIQLRIRGVARLGEAFYESNTSASVRWPEVLHNAGNSDAPSRDPGRFYARARCGVESVRHVLAHGTYATSRRCRIHRLGRPGVVEAVGKESPE